MAANYRAFLDSAEERQHAHGGITSVTVLDDAGLPTVSTDPDTVRRETRDFMSNWTRERRPPPSDVDALSGPAALIHTSQELRSTHPEVAAVLAPLPWVQRDLRRKSLRNCWRRRPLRLHPAPASCRTICSNTFRRGPGATLSASSSALRFATAYSPRR